MIYIHNLIWNLSNYSTDTPSNTVYVAFWPLWFVGFKRGGLARAETFIFVLIPVPYG
jgi:hypothetical protein